MAVTKTNSGKKQEVRQMFNNIAHRYDFLNHFLSAGIDYSWRRKAINIIGKNHPKTILDVATGTGDLAIAALKIKPEKVIGIDIAADMVEVGITKIKKKNLEEIVHLQTGDSEDLEFPYESFDAVMVAFGVRNFENLQKGLSEMYRVLKPGGQVLILEFSQPSKFPVKQFYNFYFKYILPFLGKIISGDKSAYTYLHDSVEVFPYGEKFMGILKGTGFTNTFHKPLTFGIASIYSGIK